MSFPIVSIIIPCYNQANYLADALNSVLEQTYTNWECVIVDDGSEDETESLSKLYLEQDHRFKYLYKENGGLSSARNAGIKISVGEFILPLDADDKIGKKYLESAVAILQSDRTVKVVYAKAEKFGLVNEPWPLNSYTYSNLLLNNNLYCSSFFRITDFYKTGGYDENMKSGYEDWDFWLRMLSENDRVYLIKEVNFFYRQKGYSTVYRDNKDFLKNRNYIFKKHIDLYLRHFPDPIGIFLENQVLKDLYRDSKDYSVGNKLLAPVREIVKIIKKLKRLLTKIKSNYAN